MPRWGITSGIFSHKWLLKYILTILYTRSLVRKANFREDVGSAILGRLVSQTALWHGRKERKGPFYKATFKIFTGCLTKGPKHFITVFSLQIAVDLGAAGLWKKVPHLRTHLIKKVDQEKPYLTLRVPCEDM